MGAQDDTSPNTIYWYMKVKKLQSLVQRLENENKQLKNKIILDKEDKDISSEKLQSKIPDSMIINNGIDPKTLNSSINFETKKLNPQEEFIDVDELQLSDDESWLYTPSKALSSEERSLNSYEWLRKEFEDSKHEELHFAKSALSNKLEELSSLSSPSQQNVEIQSPQKNKSSSDRETLSEQPNILNSSTGFKAEKPSSYAELIDIDEFQLSDNESWLYASSKDLSSKEISLSPFKSLRKDFEDPKNEELQFTKSALLNKVRELPNISSFNQQNAEVQITQKNKISSDAETSSEQLNVINTCTITRPKENENSIEEESGTEAKEDNAKIMPVPEVEVEHATSNVENTNDDYLTNDFGYIKPEFRELNDFIDVYEKARMQQESLKQNTPVLVSKGSCSLISVTSGTEKTFTNHTDNGRKAIIRPLTSTPTTRKSFIPLGSNSFFNNSNLPFLLPRSISNIEIRNSYKQPSAKTAKNLGLSIPHRYGLSNQRQHLQPFKQQTEKLSACTPLYRNLPVQKAHSSSPITTPVHNTENLRSRLPVLSRAHNNETPRSSLPDSSRTHNTKNPRSSLPVLSRALPRPSKLPTSKLPVASYHLRRSVAEER